jgi:hypothetical protein
MQLFPSFGIVFVGISVIFLGFAFRDYLKNEEKLTVSRKIWIRISFIFAAIGIGLYFVHTSFW